MRAPEGRWIAGVCTGLAADWRWPVTAVRLLFLVLALADGLGVILYLGLWAVLPLDRSRRADREADFVRLLAFGAAVVGIVALAATFGWGALRGWIAPVLVAGLGIAIVWQQRPGVVQGERWNGLRLVLGVLLAAVGLAALVVGEVGWSQGLRTLTVLLLIVGGAALIASPWLVRGYTDLLAERRARIREQERTELATQVHDSVLQTLTLIQAHAADSDQVARLARAEERRLRSWLYAPVGADHGSLSGALVQAAADVESQHAATIDVVHVGDAAWSPQVAALVAAAREAMLNAARHAGPQAVVSVYCEADSGGAMSVFVRDRGPGFDPAAVAADRHGVRESIVGRMERAGGAAEVVSGPAGTEVRLTVPREAG